MGQNISRSRIKASGIYPADYLVVVFPDELIRSAMPKARL